MATNFEIAPTEARYYETNGYLHPRTMYRMLARAQARDMKTCTITMCGESIGTFSVPDDAQDRLDALCGKE